MVSCLFARGVYTEARLADCLKAVGYAGLAENIAAVSQHIQRDRWRLRLATGYAPERVEIPRRFSEVVTWKGPIDTAYLDALRKEYSRRIRAMADAAKDGQAAGASTPHTP